MPWKWEVCNGLSFITPQGWKESGVRAAFSSRRGGISQDPYHSLNMGYHVGDVHNHVLSNRQRFLHALGGDLEHSVSCQQVHGNKVVRATAADKGRGAFCDDDALPGADGMVTSERGLFLLTFYADCIPIFIHDPRQQAIGLVHSGWKGTYSRIAARAIQAMKDEFATQPEDLQVFLGPGINRCCFEIQPDLAQKAQEEFPEYHDIISHDGSQALTWDLRKTLIYTLCREGVGDKNIVDCDVCTRCDTGTFFSYRGEGGTTGRMCALIALE